MAATTTLSQASRRTSINATLGPVIKAWFDAKLEGKDADGAVEYGFPEALDDIAYVHSRPIVVEFDVAASELPPEVLGAPAEWWSVWGGATLPPPPATRFKICKLFRLPKDTTTVVQIYGDQGGQWRLQVEHD
jgi:hypothetical protein